MSPGAPPRSPRRAHRIGQDRGVATRIINGRLAIDRAGVAERWHISLPTLDKRLAAHPPPPVIPEAAANRRQKWWWWADEIDPWMQAFEDRKRAALTDVDYTGDPGDLLTPKEAAAVLGYRSSDNLTPEFLDLADEVEDLPRRGKRRRWKRATVWAYAERRTGKGGTGGPVGNANPLGPRRRQIDRSGDPEELLTPRQAAAVLGYRQPGSLPKALQGLADEVREEPSGRKRRRWRRATLLRFADRQAAERPDRPDGPPADQ